MNGLRQQVLQALGEYGDRWPDMRFGQLVLAVAESARGPRVESVYDVEGAELLETCRRLLRDRVGGAPAGGKESQALV